jgi:hypothetical protein
MRALALSALAIALTLPALGCARNSDDRTGQARVRDTTLTPADSLSPNDTLDRARRAVPDTAGGLDTTSRR